MPKKVLFIVNPHAGKGQIRNHLLEITDTLVKADCEVTVYTTQNQGDAIRVTRERDKSYQLVVCSGGDGTLDEIVTGMMQSGFKTTVGYIPAGSTNDFANSLKLPSQMKKAADIVADIHLPVMSECLIMMYLYILLPLACLLKFPMEHRRK